MNRLRPEEKYHQRCLIRSYSVSTRSKNDYYSDAQYLVLKHWCYSKILFEPGKFCWCLLCLTHWCRGKQDRTWRDVTISCVSSDPVLFYQYPKMIIIAMLNIWFWYIDVEANCVCPWWIFSLCLLCSMHWCHVNRIGPDEMLQSVVSHQILFCFIKIRKWLS